MRLCVAGRGRAGLSDQISSLNPQRGLPGSDERKLCVTSASPSRPGSWPGLALSAPAAHDDAVATLVQCRRSRKVCVQQHAPWPPTAPVRLLPSPPPPTHIHTRWSRPLRPIPATPIPRSRPGTRPRTARKARPLQVEGEEAREGGQQAPRHRVAVQLLYRMHQAVLSKLVLVQHAAHLRGAPGPEGRG